MLCYRSITKMMVGLFALTLLAGCGGGTTATQIPAGPTQAPAMTEAAAPAETQAPAGARTLRVMTHDSFAISEEALAKFQSENNVTVQFIKSGDVGTALNKAILAKDNPLADVFYGVDNTFLSRALSEDIFEPYASPALAGVPAEFQLDPSQSALPIDYGDVCLNYDKAFFEKEGLAPPASLDDLLKQEYKGLLVVTNPATSSPGLAFLLATVGVYGADGYLDYWKQLSANDMEVVNDWETAYYTEFSGSSGRGPRPIVVSYSSSPAFEMIYAETPLDEPPTAAVTADNTCFRQIEYAGVLRGAKEPELARKWIDFMLSPTFQEDVPMQMFVFPVSPQAKLDEVFTKYLVNPAKTVTVAPDEIAANREQWLKDWTEAVLR